MKSLVLVFSAALVFALSCPRAECAPKHAPGGPVVKRIQIVGNDHLSQKKIRAVMRTQQSKWLRAKRLRESTLESDLISIVALYGSNGFLEAQATIDEERFDENRAAVWITIKIVEGTQTRVKEITITGNSRVATDALRRLLSVKPGDPLDERHVGEDEYNIYVYYADRGFVFASISHTLEGVDGNAALTYAIHEGEPAGIAQIDVRGNSRIAGKLIRREVTLKTGDTFSRKKLLDSQQKLYDTGFFKDVAIEPSQSASDSGLVDLVVRVKERRLREASAGLGYGTREEARLTLGWLHRDLWNSGLQLEARTILASMDFHEGLTRKRADLSLTDRWLFGVRLVGVASVFVNETREEYKLVSGGRYTLDRIGFNLGVQKDISRSTKATLSYTHEIVDIRNLSWHVDNRADLRLTLGQEINRSASLLFERDTRVPFFDPHQGSVARVVAKTSGGVLGGDNSFNKYTLSAARYLGLHRRSVLAVGARIGQAEAFGRSQDQGVPDYERFFVGGSSTVRGYDEKEFGPGDFFFVGNVEFRYALVWKLTAVAFLDMGNAWGSIRQVKASDFVLRRSASDYTPRRDTDFKYSTGLGLGIQTPVGPARIDYGMRLKRGYLSPGKREGMGMVHVSIGYAF